MEKLCGFINVNKPSGMSSAAVVSKIKRLTGTPCGHMGTLDPMAKGVLPVALGNACRLFNYLLEKEKVYRAAFRFGVETDTLDSEGVVIREELRVPSIEEVQSVLGEFTGKIMQMPPAYSAKSIGGVRAYKLARQGKEVVLTPKEVLVEEIRLERQINSDSFEFVIRCGGGTYIRSLARDIAARLGTVGIMTSLIREKSGYFTLENSVTLETAMAEGAEKFLIPAEHVFEMETMYFTGENAKKIRCGLSIASEKESGLYKIYLDDIFYGIAEVSEGQIRAKSKIC